MKLLDALMQMKPSDLTRWAKSLGLSVWSTTNGSIAERLAERLLDEQELAKRIAALRDPDRSALMLFLLLGEEELVRERLHDIFGRSKRDPVAGLLGQGMLFRAEERARHFRRREEILWTPPELRLTLWRVVLRDEKAHSIRLAPDVCFGDVVCTMRRTKDASELERVNEEETYSLLTDLLLFLAALKRSKVRLKNDGIIYRADQRAVVESFTRPEPVPDAKSGYDYSFRLGFIYNCATALGLVDQQKAPEEESHRGELCLNPQAEAWINLDLQTRIESMLAYVYCHPLAHEEALWGVWELAANLPDDAWIMMDPLLEILDDLTIHSFRRHVANQMDVALQYFQAVGAVELAQITDERNEEYQELAIRLNGLGQAFVRRERPQRTIECEPHFFVQATGEVLASSRLEHELLWFLERVCHLEKSDQMRVYRLARDCVLAAFDDGLERESLLSFFDRHAQGGLPQNVQFMLEEWCANWGQVRLSAALLVECGSEAIADRVQSDERIGRYVLRRIGPKALVVDARYAEAIRQSLADAGMPTSQRIPLEVGEAGRPSMESVRRALRLWRFEIDRALASESSAGGSGWSEDSFHPFAESDESGYLDRYGTVMLDRWLFDAGAGVDVSRHPLDLMESGKVDPRSVKPPPLERRRR